jgi:hypothetical protein
MLDRLVNDGMSHANLNREERQSMVLMSHSLKMAEMQKKERPELLAKLKPKGTSIFYIFLVE